jgi:hypothetical protein
MKRALLSFLALLALLFSAFAQSQSLQPPWDYPLGLGTTSVRVLPVDPLRWRILFFNPSQTATVAYCQSQVT